MNYAKFDHAADSVPTSLESVRYHTGQSGEFRPRALNAVRRAVAQRPAAEKDVVPHLRKWATDSRMLRTAWNRQARHGGQAPGPNGRRYSDLSSDEVWNLLKAVSQSLRNGTYQPQPARRIEVPKDPLNPGRGTRPISLINVEDRVIQRAIVDLLVPLRDSHLGELVFGSRPGRSPWLALAQLEHLASKAKRWVWIAEDVENAFENVRRAMLRDVLLKGIPDPQLVELIITLVNNGRKRGIQQGGPLSPFLLNEYLGHFLERRWAKVAPEVPLFRYVDDLLALCRTKKEAADVGMKLRDRLHPAGMQLKQENPVRDLRRGESVEWLGYTLSRDGHRLRVRIAAKAWSRLCGKLTLAHEQPNAPLQASEIINGWIDQLGPCYEFERRTDVLARITAIAGSLGFDEIPSRKALRERWRRADQRWQELREQVNTPGPSVAFQTDLDPLEEGTVPETVPPF